MYETEEEREVARKDANKRSYLKHKEQLRQGALPGGEAKRITASARRKLGITEKEFDALLDELSQKQGPSVTREDISVIVQSLQDFKGHEAGVKYLAKKLTDAGVGVKDDNPQAR